PARIMAHSSPTIVRRSGSENDVAISLANLAIISGGYAPRKYPVAPAFANVQRGHVEVVTAKLAWGVLSTSQPAPRSGVLMHTGNFQVGVLGTTFAFAGSMKNRSVVVVRWGGPESQMSFRFTTGTPGWLTNVGRI